MDFVDGLERLLIGSRIYGIRLISMAPDGQSMFERLADSLVESEVIAHSDRERFIRSVAALTVDASEAENAELVAKMVEATQTVCS